VTYQTEEEAAEAENRAMTQ